MPDPNNPLSYIGQSNDPSLTQRTVDTNRSLQEMRRNLGQIAATGRWDELTSNIDAASREKVADIGAAATRHGHFTNRGFITPEMSPEMATTQRQITDVDLAKKIAETVHSARQGGLELKPTPSGSNLLPGLRDIGLDTSVVSVPPIQEHGARLSATQQEEGTKTSQKITTYDFDENGLMRPTVTTTEVFQKQRTRGGQESGEGTINLPGGKTVPAKHIDSEKTVASILDASGVTEAITAELERVGQGWPPKGLSVFEGTNSFYINFNGTAWIEIPK